MQELMHSTSGVEVFLEARENVKPERHYYHDATLVSYDETHRFVRVLQGSDVVAVYKLEHFLGVRRITARDEEP